MKLVWDERKRLANLTKHKLDFADVIFFDWEGCHISKAHSGRSKAVGRFRDGTSVVVYATLGTEAMSVISFRPASAKERKVLE